MDLAVRLLHTGPDHVRHSRRARGAWPGRRQIVGSTERQFVPPPLRRPITNIVAANQIKQGARAGRWSAPMRPFTYERGRAKQTWRRPRAWALTPDKVSRTRLFRFWPADDADRPDGCVRKPGRVEARMRRLSTHPSAATRKMHRRQGRTALAPRRPRHPMSRRRGTFPGRRGPDTRIDRACNWRARVQLRNQWRDAGRQTSCSGTRLTIYYGDPSSERLQTSANPGSGICARGSRVLTATMQCRRDDQRA